MLHILVAKAVNFEGYHWAYMTQTRSQRVALFAMQASCLFVGPWFSTLGSCNTPKYSTDCIKKATVHQVTTVLATSKNALIPGHNHMLLTAGADDPTLWLSPECQQEWRVISAGG